jgi:hypothetical protein
VIMLGLEEIAILDAVGPVDRSARWTCEWGVGCHATALHGVAGGERCGRSGYKPSMSYFTAWLDFVTRLGAWFSQGHSDDFPPDDLLAA